MNERDSQADGLCVRTGAERHDEVEAEETGARAAELRVALDGIRSIRGLTNSGPEPQTRPAEWERRRLLRTVSLLLEAAGLAPSAVGADGEPARTGYRTDAGERAGLVVVRWVGPRGSGARYQERESLLRCRQVLRDWGFEALEVRGPGGRRHLEVEAGPG
ncbi:hypothetical protein [Streptomyces sp. NRRL S-1448]|uniref:hypothetical protein n=1 Tax=Streptomyces sp. NRRL S-1448 TaxID=1463883 RepID=UPI000A8E7AEB|nr:hypothetical protein [Streptomyces sp. NRRL S-1448]